MGSVDGASVRDNLIVCYARCSRHRNVDFAAVKRAGAYPRQNTGRAGHPPTIFAPAAGICPTRSHALPYG